MRTEDREVVPSSRLPLEPRFLIVIAGTILFALLTVLVDARRLAVVDYDVSVAKQGMVNPLLDGWAAAVSILASGELSVLYGAIGTYLLWSRGLGLWSLAPLAFLIGVPLEVASKLMVRQPSVPPEFWRPAQYPLVSFTLNGSFPSGHAMRSGFFCVFLAVLLWSGGGRAARLASLGFLLLAAIFGFARIYGGQHWLSDVIAGLDLGAILALLVATPLARRLRGNG